MQINTVTIMQHKTRPLMVMSIYSVIWHFFSILTFFYTLTGNGTSNRLNIIIFMISRSISVEIDTSLALFQKYFFGGHFELVYKMRSAILAEVTNRFRWFWIANRGRKLSTFSAILKKFDAKLRQWECQIEKVKNVSHDVIPITNCQTTAAFGLQTYLPHHFDRKWRIQST